MIEKLKQAWTVCQVHSWHVSVELLCMIIFLELLYAAYSHSDLFNCNAQLLWNPYKFCIWYSFSLELTVMLMQIYNCSTGSKKVILWTEILSDVLYMPGQLLLPALDQFKASLSLGNGSGIPKTTDDTVKHHKMAFMNTKKRALQLIFFFFFMNVITQCISAFI